MTVHLLYPYRTDPLDGQELRYSLRSVARHLHMGDIDITVVGDKPGWLTGVRHIQADNIHDTKAANMARKTWIGCVELAGTRNPVVYMEDDYILLDHATSVPPVYWGDLNEHIANIERFHGKGFWMSEAMRNTSLFLGDLPDQQSWELHRPTPIDPARVAPIIEPIATSGYPALCRSVWGTLTLDGWRGRDSRYTQTKASPTRLPWVSLDERVPLTIKRMFPEPCRWEKPKEPVEEREDSDAVAV